MYYQVKFQCVDGNFYFLGEWCHWSNHVGEYVYPTDEVPDYTSILVPNVDNTRTSFLIETIAKQRKVILFPLNSLFPLLNVFMLALVVIKQCFIFLGSFTHR